MSAFKEINEHNKNQKDIGLIKECIAQIKSKCSIKVINAPNISIFDLYNKNTKVETLDSWKITCNKFSFILCLLEFETSYETAGVSGGLINLELNKYFFGYLNLNKDFGNIMIRPKTFSDKLSAFLKNVNKKTISHNRFNRNYFLEVSNNNNLNNLNCLNLLDCISSYKNIYLEFNNNQLLFRFPKSINPEDAIRLTEIGCRLDEIINHKL